MNIKDMESSAASASEMLKALANEDRLLILCQLADGEKTVGELTRLIGLAQPAVSQHLARLRREGLVGTRRESQTIWYSLVSTEAGQVIALLYELYCAPKNKSARRPGGSSKKD